ncbi:MAG: histidine phosphatase family protein [Acidobacteriaceae bacterium]|nr:histidine phosphatase family protein [Acidobacteriaceae bacterium]
MTRYWLIRHGEPAEETRGRCYGSLNVGLSDRGREQMRRVAEVARPGWFDCVYSSPARRALESARILAAAAGCAVRTAGDLRELHFGDFEGLTYEEAAARDPELYQRWMEAPTEARFPNGESFREMQARVMGAFEAIRREHEGETVAIVSHGGVNRILLAWALGMPDEKLFRIAQRYGAVNLLRMVEGTPVVEAMNAHRLTY